MQIKYDPTEYEMPWRTNFEANAAFAWLVAAITAAITHIYSDMPVGIFIWMISICLTMGIMHVPRAWRLYKLQRNLGGRALEFCDLKHIEKKKKDHELWLGYGFEWESRHAQRVFEILKRDWAQFGVKRSRSLFQRNPSAPNSMGQRWIHGVEPKERLLSMPLAHNNLHTLIVGTTGSGKTRMFDVFISQAILRSPLESIVIIDPKGDKELRDNAKRACASMGMPERFVEFNPANPTRSVRLDPLRNYSRATEIASRIASLIQSDGPTDPFKAFSWQALNNIVQGLLITGQKLSLIVIRRFLEGGAAELVVDAIEAHAKTVMGPNWNGIPYRANSTVEQKAKSATTYYFNKLQGQFPNHDLEGLLSMHMHDSTHFSKMVANLLPIMNMLTSGVMGDLLSAHPIKNDQRKVVDCAKLIGKGQVLYIALDSLTDSIVGSALGSLILSDLTAVAGERYNKGLKDIPVNLFVDEAAEVVNDPFIQILNKGRGAGFSSYIATQTIADFSARLGSKEKTIQVLANVNNVFALRITDPETQEYVTDNLPKTRLKYVMLSQGQNTDNDHPLLHGANQSERLMEEESELFPTQLLGMLPNLEYVAKISGGRVIKGRLPILTHQ